MRFLSRFRILAAALLVAMAMLATVPVASAAEIVMFAAASLKEALDEAARVYGAQSGDAVKISYAASSALAKQIESGAPADMFISADLDWMDYLQQRNLIQPGTRKNLLGNRLVIVAAADSDVKLDIEPGFNLTGALKGGHLAMADPDSVPAGKYGKAALEKLGIWSSVRSAVAPAESVRGALLFVSRGEAPLGVVYATDAAAEPRVRIVGTFPEGAHPPIIYPLVLTAESKSSSAPRLLEFLVSPAARAIFEKRGFTVLADTDAQPRWALIGQSHSQMPQHHVRPLAQLSGGAGKHGASLDEDHASVGERIDRPVILVDDDHSGSVLANHPDDPPYLAADQWGEAFRRLVENDQLGVGHQGATDTQHLLLAAGELSAAVAQALREPWKGREHPIEVPFAPAVHAGVGRHDQVFADTEIGKNPAAFGDKGNARSSDGVRSGETYIDAAQIDGAAARPRQADQAAQ
jgi:molybdate transport system substrate-binding protein